MGIFYFAGFMPAALLDSGFLNVLPSLGNLPIEGLEVILAFTREASIQEVRSLVLVTALSFMAVR